MSTVERPVDLCGPGRYRLRFLLNGDSSRMFEFVERVTPVLWHVCGQSLSRTAAEDVVQQTWLRLIENAQRISDPRGVLKWLMTTTRRESWRLAQRASRENAVPDIPEPATPEAQSVVNQVLGAEEHAVLCATSACPSAVSILFELSLLRINPITRLQAVRYAARKYWPYPWTMLG